MGAFEISRAIDVRLCCPECSHPDMPIDRRRTSLIDEEAPIFADTVSAGMTVFRCTGLAMSVVSHTVTFPVPPA